MKPCDETKRPVSPEAGVPLPAEALSAVSGGTWTGTELAEQPAGRKWVQVAHVCGVVEDSSLRQAKSEEIAAGEGAQFYVAGKRDKPLF